MKNQIIIAVFFLTVNANADCMSKFKPSIMALGNLNGDAYSEVSTTPELINDSKYSFTYQGTAKDADGNRIVFEVETKKSCEVTRIESLGET